MTVRRMLRHTVIVSNNPQTLTIEGTPVRVEASRIGVGPDAPHIVEFWAEGSFEGPGRKRTFQVVGTGHLIPEHARWRGTTSRTPEGLVWHLYEIFPEDS